MSMLMECEKGGRSAEGSRQKKELLACFLAQGMTRERPPRKEEDS